MERMTQQELIEFLNDSIASLETENTQISEYPIEDRSFRICSIEEKIRMLRSIQRNLTTLKED
jgi:hypothetical protein